MNIKDVYDTLKQGVLETLTQEGYKYKADKYGAEFKKKTSFGFIELGYGVINYDPVYKIPGFGYLIRYDKVEEVCTLFNQEVDGNSNPRNICTVGGGYGGIVNIKHHDFGEMYTIEDVEKVAQEIKGIYQDILKPFLEQHSDMYFLENEINKDTERDLPYIMYWRGRRSMRGLILAKLCHNPRYEELKSIYHQKCIEQDDSEVLEAYDNLVNYLDNEYQEAK
jgi:hypothetical protein